LILWAASIPSQEKSSEWVDRLDSAAADCTRQLASFRPVYPTMKLRSGGFTPP
jgi:hypothetical protein